MRTGVAFSTGSPRKSIALCMDLRGCLRLATTDIVPASPFLSHTQHPFPPSDFLRPSHVVPRTDRRRQSTRIKP